MLESLRHSYSGIAGFALRTAVQGSTSRAVGSFEAVLEVPESASSRGVPTILKLCGRTPGMVQEVHE